MNAEIISVGTELLLGNTVNTDAADVSQALSELGINVYHHTVVGDNPARLEAAVATARSRADLIVTTGGLGPTVDDLTKQTLAKAFGLELVFHPECADAIQAYFDSIGREMTQNNLQQAYLPEGCTVFRNDWGTAPACAFEKDGVQVVMLPGPPRECRNILRYRAVPYLMQQTQQVIRSHFVHIFGMGESAVEARLHDMMAQLQDPTVAPYCREGEVMVRVTAAAQTAEKAEEKMAPVVAKILQELGDVVYSVDVDTLEETVLALLEARGQTVTTAESCTGGLLAKRLTDIAGSSAVFPGGLVTYCDAQKAALLGVPETLLETCGAVSEEVAAAMAQGARRVMGTDFALATTGIAGPDGDGSGKPVGLIYVALASEEQVWCVELRLNGDRERNRTMAANSALDLLRRQLTGLKSL